MEETKGWISLNQDTPTGWGEYLVYIVENREFWQDEYISKTERRSVLIKDSYKRIEIQHFENLLDWLEMGVTHYMPLPEPPK